METGPGTHSGEEGSPSGRRRQPRRKGWFWGVLLLVIVLVLVLLARGCHRDPLPVSLAPSSSDSILRAPTQLPESLPTEEPAAADSLSVVADTPSPKPLVTPPSTAPTDSHVSHAVLETIPRPPNPFPEAALPYLYADPWGGRHFDSIQVKLFCREDCVILYSLDGNVHFKSYDAPITIHRNSTLWLSGIDSNHNHVEPIRIEYVIEKDQGKCGKNMMPFEWEGRSICMDIYEWPNLDGEQPSAFVSHAEAADSCRLAGKRLCRLEEWQHVCRGPVGDKYPYGNRYNENYCPSKETGASRSGRFPACRSYYGNFDMTGNVWEWTSTPAKGRDDFFMVAGGNWSTGNEATCEYGKYSFFPQNRYLFVGFRCCQDAPR